MDNIPKKVPVDDPKAKIKLALKNIRTAHPISNMDPEALEKQRKSQEIIGHLATPMIGNSWETFDIDGMPAAWVRPERGHDKRNVILYCHGGGYTTGNLGSARILANKLAYATGYEVMIFEYRLAPEHPYPAALDDGMRAWNYLMHLGYGAREVVLVGDSAGGNMALVLTTKLRDAGRILPRRLVLLSPWTDMTASGKSYTDKLDCDPTITLEYLEAIKQVYAPNANYKDPNLSPLFGSFHQFPPVLIQVGDNEILMSDSIRLRDRLVNSGIPCRLESWKGMWHVFQMMPGKTSQQAMDSIGSFLLDFM